MKVTISKDARPQAMMLLAAVALSIVLWFVPFGGILSFPFRLFVTFIHEGGHALAALITGNSVQSLSVAFDGSGETYTTNGGTLSQMLVSSAGYLGAMTFGAILLVLIRRAVAVRLVLAGSSLLILALTLVFGLFKPIVSGSWGSLASVPFTVIAGVAVAVGLFAVARFASKRVAMFVTSLLAAQCVLDAVLDLKTVFFLSSPFGSGVATDAVNMANATGVPAIVWTIIWIVVAIAILGIALRMYVAARDRAFDPQADLPFEGRASA